VRQIVGDLELVSHHYVSSLNLMYEATSLVSLVKTQDVF